MYEYLSNTVSCQIFGIKFDFGENRCDWPRWYDFHLGFDNKFQIDYYHWRWTIKCFTSILKWWAVWGPPVVHISFGLVFWKFTLMANHMPYKNMIKFKIVFMPMESLLLLFCFLFHFGSCCVVLCYAMLTSYIYLVCSFIHSFHFIGNGFLCSRPKRCMLRCLGRKNVDIWSNEMRVTSCTYMHVLLQCWKLL